MSKAHKEGSYYMNSLSLCRVEVLYEITRLCFRTDFLTYFSVKMSVRRVEVETGVEGPRDDDERTPT